MKFLIFLFVFLCITQTSALEFSPTNLEFNLTKNQQVCKKIFFTLDSGTTISDFWAGNENVPWSVTQFQTSAQDLGININYPIQISSDQTQTEICISGTRAGNYRGVLIFKQGEQGNSIVQFGVWIKLLISEEILQETPEIENEPRRRSRNSNGGINRVVQEEKQQQNFQEIDFDFPEEKIELGNSISEKSIEKQNSLIQIFAILSVVVVFMILIFLVVKKFYSCCVPLVQAPFIQTIGHIGLL